MSALDLLSTWNHEIKFYMIHVPVVCWTTGILLVVFHWNMYNIYTYQMMRAEFLDYSIFTLEEIKNKHDMFEN